MPWISWILAKDSARFSLKYLLFFCGFPIISDKIPMSSNVAGKSPKIPELNDYSSKNHLEMGGIWYHPT